MMKLMVWASNGRELASQASTFPSIGAVPKIFILVYFKHQFNTY